MLDRGLRRRFDPAVERAAREAAARPPRGDVPARRPARPADVHDRPADRARLRRRDLRRAPRRTGACASGSTSPTSPPTCAPGSLVDREAHRRATSVYVPGAVEPMLPEALSNDACSLVPAPGPARGHRRARLRRAPRWRARAFHRSLIRSDARLDYPQVDRDLRGRGARPRRPGRSRSPPPGRSPRALEAARAGARRARRRVRRAGVPLLTARATSPSWCPSEQTESHRLIEHLMIAANEAVAALLESRGLPTLYRVHERPDRARVERLADQLASLDVPTPPLPEHDDARSRPTDLVGEISRLVAEHVRRTGHGRAALTSLVLRSLKQARYSAREPRPRRPALARATATSPRRSAATRTSSCHRALLAAIGAGEDPPPRRADATTLGEWCSARERDAMAIERARRRRRPLLPARARAVRARLGAREFDRRGHRA